MGVMMQTFFWDCPRIDKKEFQWWNFIRKNIASLARTGFTALWLPPVHKGGNLAGPSMGYDPYDYYDLGEFNQKGTIATWFGTRAELDELIEVAHSYRLSLITDMVLNHNGGADGQEINPMINQSRWTLFNPKSGRFLRNWECFHPCLYEAWDEMTFGDMPDLAHRNPYVFTELLKLARWLIEEIGFDGFRYDFAKGYGSETITAIQQYRYTRNNGVFIPYGVAEYWDSAKNTLQWVDNSSNFSASNPVDAFDFPLREMLKALCDQSGLSLRNLTTWATILQRQPQTTATFVENHDMRDNGLIINEKLLAYSYILTHEGFPCVFWYDYFNLDLAMSDTPNGIAALVGAHEKYAGGATNVLHVDDDLYIMQRTGYGDRPGLVYVLNNRGDIWNGRQVITNWSNASFQPAAWWGKTDIARPNDQTSDNDGRAQFYAPPRGYVVYAVK